jgi:hypothetical protein
MCDSDESSDYSSKAFRRARKEHKCVACPNRILPGHRYHVSTVGMRGEGPESFKHCMRCWAICKALWKAGADYVQYDLDCGERWEENFGELPADVAALAFMTPDEAQMPPTPADIDW